MSPQTKAVDYSPHGYCSFLRLLVNASRTSGRRSVQYLCGVSQRLLCRLYSTRRFQGGSESSPLMFCVVNTAVISAAGGHRHWTVTQSGIALATTRCMCSVPMV